MKHKFLLQVTNIFKLAQARARKEGEFLFVCFWFMQLEMWRYDMTHKLTMLRVLSFHLPFLVLFPLVWPHSQEMLSYQVATAQCLYVPWHPSTWKAEKCPLHDISSQSPKAGMDWSTEVTRLPVNQSCDQSHNTAPGAGDYSKSHQNWSWLRINKVWVPKGRQSCPPHLVHQKNYEWGITSLNHKPSR